MPDEKDDIRRWRTRAAELRRLAATASPSAKDRILEVARGYEIMAADLVERTERDVSA